LATHTPKNDVPCISAVADSTQIQKARVISRQQ